ncbi:MAG: alpha-amylase/4-alpha-glucanotransferase domain-containing protein, partial [Planctomycetota bacterium]
HVTHEAVASGEAVQQGDFVDGSYDAVVRRNPGRTQIFMTRVGSVRGKPLPMTKAITITAGSSTLEIAYQLERLPKTERFTFAVELNFAGMPSGLDDRYFYDADQNRLGELGTHLELSEVDHLGLVDEWLGLDVGLTTSRPTSFWTFPVETVSQSEGGFELIHQSVAVQPHWIVTPDSDGRWTVSIRLSIDTARAEARTENHAVAATT